MSLQFYKLFGSAFCGINNGEVQGVSLGCLNDEAEIFLERHIFVGSTARWDRTRGHSLQYKEYPPISED